MSYMLRGYDNWKTAAPEPNETEPHEVHCETCGHLDDAPAECADLDDMTDSEMAAVAVYSLEGEACCLDCARAGRPLSLIWLQPRKESGPPCRCGDACYC